MADSDSSDAERRRSLTRRLEYDCVERFRLRRLISFLWRNRYNGAFEALSKETRVLFCIEHLQYLVRVGKWPDAVKYVYHFTSFNHLPRSADFLVTFIRFVSYITKNLYGQFVPYRYNQFSSYEIRRNDGTPNGPGGIKLAEIMSSVRSKEVSGSINWACIRFKAAEIVADLVYQIPELNDMLRMPLCTSEPANVLPIGPSSRGHRGLRKKRLGQMSADALARSFLSKKRLSSSSHPGLSRETRTMTQLAGLIEECLEAGKCVALNADSIETCAEVLSMHEWSGFSSPTGIERN